MRRIILTASGGAFRDWDVDRLASVTVCGCQLALHAKKHTEIQCL
jgi:1-deoxy-D-xylulose 5-phosphate reductoisomerase